MAHPSLNRRTLLQGTAGVAALAAGGPLLAGCGDGGSSESAETNAKVKLPTYVPYQGVEPDLPGTKAGVQNGFTAYPKERPKSVTGKVGSGGKVSALAILYYPVPPGPSRNRFWAGLNERLGADLRMTMVPNGDFDDKYATVVAGDDLPDFMQIYGDRPQVPGLLKSKFADLTELLSGDAIKEYPNLANIPTRSWRATVFNGGIYGIPVPREVIGGEMFYRADILEKAGVDAEPANADEFFELCKELTDPKAGQWSNGTHMSIIDFSRRMLRGPNNWREKGGKLTHLNESEEDREALQFAIRCYKAGLIHPDGFAENVPFKQWVNEGTTVMHFDNYPAWTQYTQDNASNPEFKLGLMPIPGFDGGKGGSFQGAVNFSFTAFKKAGKSRLQEQLRIANWLAAPFGTEEYFYLHYGVEGVDHTVAKNGEPTLTSTGQKETVVPVRYITESPQALYEAGRPEDAKTQHAYQMKAVPESIPDPVVGLYSETQATKKKTIDLKLDDLRKEVVQGRKSMKDWDAGVKAWLSGGGEKIREELQEALQRRG